MTLTQIIALVAAIQGNCSQCPKVDTEAINEAAEAYQLPADVLVWTAYFEASLSTKQVGEKGERGPVQIIPGGPLSKKCASEGLEIASWKCASSVLKYEWTQCEGDWVCFWKVHACGRADTQCGTKIAKTREWLRKRFQIKKQR